MSWHTWWRRAHAARAIFGWQVYRCSQCRDYVFTRSSASAFLSSKDCPKGGES